MTVLEVIRRSTEYLTRHWVESPRLQVELLLAHVLRLPRLNLYLQFDRVLGPSELEPLRDLVRRRGAREPLQHLTGTAPFLDHVLQVGPAVLIPRPETETLAARAVELGRGIPGGCPRVLDLGTGSGCLAIALAAGLPGAEVHAVDLSPEALEVARGNAVRTGVADRVRFGLGDGFAALAGIWPGPEAVFNLVVSNPPYIPTAEIATLAPEVRDHDPRMALDGGADGLDFYRRLAVEAAAWVCPGGWMLLEFGDGQGPAVDGLMDGAGWVDGVLEKDLSGRERVIIVRRPPASPRPQSPDCPAVDV